MGKKTLLLQQISGKIQAYSALQSVAAPPSGWIKAIRSALGMSLQQLGNKLGVSKQAVLDMENREKEGSITLRSLREIGRAMDMQLVYGFIPHAGSLDALIEKRAMELATQIVLRSANTMQLEDQANSTERIQTAIRERAAVLQQEMPKFLWD
jgi:predicted DNA-binding mobile mystery protein A